MKNIASIAEAARGRKILFVVLGIIVLTVAWMTLAMASGDYDMPWTTGAGDNCGGGERTSDSYVLTDVAGQTAPGSSSSTNYHLTAGFLSIMPIDTGTSAMVKVYVTLQGNTRPYPEGWEVPISVGFFPANSGTLVMSGSGAADYWFEGTASGTITESGTRAWFQCPDPVACGNYDITTDSSTTLLNVKRNVGIQ